jgi:hypothetical protein
MQEWGREGGGKGVCKSGGERLEGEGERGKREEIETTLNQKEERGGRIILELRGRGRDNSKEGRGNRRGKK